MTESGSKYMTERQRYWFKHIQACEASGKRIAEYAADQQIDAKAMYAGNARSRWSRKAFYPARVQHGFSGPRYRDPLTGKHYVFLTNHFALRAKTIADIYKQRWQIELYFKWIKQNLKIKTFIGTSKNAVMTQIWIALCV